MLPDTPIMLSALQHYSYCPRQCALIHLEQTFTDNAHTVRGHLAHERVDSGESGLEYGIRVERSLPLYSERYGLTGRADVVEFDADGTPYPIEYKQGKRQQKIHDEAQLVGQALCLEEMTGKTVTKGAIFHHKSRRRREVLIDEAARAYVLALIEQVRGMLDGGRLPPPTDDDALCRACSLRDTCQPELAGQAGRIRQLHRGLFAVDDSA